MAAGSVGRGRGSLGQAPPLALLSAPPLARAAPSHSSGLCADVAPKSSQTPHSHPGALFAQPRWVSDPGRPGRAAGWWGGASFLEKETRGARSPPLKSPGKAKASGCHQPWEPLGQPVFVPPREAGAQRPCWAKGPCPGCVLGPRRPAQQRKCSTSGPGTCPEVRVGEDRWPEGRGEGQQPVLLPPAIAAGFVPGKSSGPTGSTPPSGPLGTGTHSRGSHAAPRPGPRDG